MPVLRKASKDSLQRLDEANVQHRALVDGHRQHRLSLGLYMGGLLGVLCPYTLALCALREAHGH